MRSRDVLESFDLYVLRTEESTLQRLEGRGRGRRRAMLVGSRLSVSRISRNLVVLFLPFKTNP